jgi:ATP-dependent helicase/nuclease subunit B
MASIAKNDFPKALRAFAYGVEHPAMALWMAPETGVLARIAAEMQRLGAHPARTLVLLPYAQLLPLAQRLWPSAMPQGFAPRFETTLNWVAASGGFVPGPLDITFDAAMDTLTAQALLAGSGMAGREELAPLLVQAACQLAPLAAAAGPTGRAAWAQAARFQAVLGMESEALAWEAQVARVAVEWAAASAYASDALFDTDIMASLDCLILVQGLAADPLAVGLQPMWQDKLVTLLLATGGVQPTLGALALHACLDTEDEAQRTAACALRHIAEDRFPLALVSSDRALTRRVRAMLEGAGVRMRDENGWKLSTSLAAASVMAGLRAAVWNASTDAVLAWLKRSPTAQPWVHAMERALRRDQVRDWRDAAAAPSVVRDANLVLAHTTVQTWRNGLAGRKSLQGWLAALEHALQACGLWLPLQDAAGAKVLAALRLSPEDPARWAGLLGDALWAQRKWDLAEFTAWVNHALESTSFQPDYPDEEQVVILPMSQMLARPFAAVVLAGCDEVRLNPSPEPPGNWTPAQRAALGLPARADLEAQLRASWRFALQSPHCDVLWRTSDDAGEALMPSALVQLLELEYPRLPRGDDPRALRAVPLAPVPPPMPRGDQVPVAQISASAYEDLRQCPYRFFALRQLGLKSEDELDAGVDKRDFGLWLHAVLQRFHEALAAQPATERLRRSELLDQMAEAQTTAMALPQGEFLPFAAAWPAVRDGYLQWLEKYEAEGGVFASGETSHTQRIGNLKLVGRIDRTDTLKDGSVMVLDYKTEPTAKTRLRLKDPMEDTQIAFYAALLPHDTLRAAYVNVGERDGTVLCEQTEVVHARDALIAGMLDDMQRIAQGEPLPALGDGGVCDFCQARGLCRKDGWTIA